VRQGGYHKNAVFSLTGRETMQVRSWHVDAANAENLVPIISENIAKEAHLMTDQAKRSRKVGEQFASHETVDHSWDENLRYASDIASGNETLRLDNVATMRLAPEYSLTSISLWLDAAPVSLKFPAIPGLQIEQPQLTVHPKQKFTFDVAKNKRQEVAVAGRIFVITLFDIKQLDVPGVTNPIEYVFGISEK
jgi:hypothetical protein